MASRAAENDLTLFDHDLNDTVEYEDLSMKTSNSGNIICPNKRTRLDSEDSGLSRK